MRFGKSVMRVALVAGGMLVGGMSEGGGSAVRAQEQPRAAGEVPRTAQPLEVTLPEGWTMEDVQACVVAATPGEAHQLLLRDVGKWECKTSSYMAPDQDPVRGECVAVVTPLMDGRYIQVDMRGDLPGLGPYAGLGTFGFDIAKGKYSATWLDNQSTSMMVGVGNLSEDGKVMAWKFQYTCPITKKPTTMREVETYHSADEKTLEMFTINPKTGKESKMMQIDMKRVKE